jgi:hypothetical protein
MSYDSPDGRNSQVSSRLDHSFTGLRSSSSCLGDSLSTTTQSKASTAFSRPFTSYSFQSTTTGGAQSTLTNKLERMNKAAMKMMVKQVLAC